MDNKIARNLSLRHFRAFVHVAECGSFSRAATVMAISQPALTLSIQQFEDIVGVPLLLRTTRSVSVTAQGEELLPKAQAILREVNAAILSARASAERQDNRIRIAALPSVAIRVLPKAIRSYAALAPDVTVDTQDDNGRGVETQVLNGAADFGISNIWSNTPDLSFRPFIRDRMGLICRADHDLAGRDTPLRWSCLADLSFVGMAEDTGISRLTRDRDALPESVRNPDFTVLTISALVGLVENGTAVTALPALAAPDYLNPSLVYRPLSGPVLYRELQLIAPRSRPLSGAAQAFLRHLLDSGPSLSASFSDHTVEAIHPED